VAKTSAGAVEYVPVARVSNIAETIDSLKKEGVWFYAADMKAKTGARLTIRAVLGLLLEAKATA
jgi:23S rRNA (guanosine2251-2'-O)-methyltransferase